jgi:hypothetical protein
MTAPFTRQITPSLFLTLLLATTGLAFGQEPAPEAPPIPPKAPDQGPVPAPPGEGPRRTEGCALGLGGPNDPNWPTPLKTSGDLDFDARVNADLNVLSRWFQVMPRLYFFDDDVANAFSSGRVYGDPDDFPPERSQFGSILFGKKLLKAEMAGAKPGEPNFVVTAIMAHELGHTLQGLRNYPLPTVYKELHADFMAGWTVKHLQRVGAPNVDVTKIFGSFYNRGDVEFNNEEHHGTRKERLNAFLEGFEIEEDNVNVAFDRGDMYVRNLPIQAAREYFARNLSMYYVTIGNPDGTFGLRVTRPPAADSPVGRGGIELGDVIVALDEMPIRTSDDVARHFGRTTIVLIDVKTGQPQQTVIELPQP